MAAGAVAAAARADAPNGAARCRCGHGSAGASRRRGGPPPPPRSEVPPVAAPAPRRPTVWRPRCGPHPPPPPRRGRRTLLALAAATAAAAWAVGAPPPAAAQPAPPPPLDGATIDAVFSKSAGRVLQVAKAAREALEPDDPCVAESALDTCACTASPCADTFSKELTCAADFGPNKQTCGGSACTQAKLDYTSSFVQIGRGLVEPDGATSLAIAKDVCVTKSMDVKVFRSLRSARQFTYFATANGVFRLHPGRAGEVKPLDECTRWDPRLRPWYSEASSGPKDVVIAIDASADMTKKMATGGTRSRWEVAVLAAIDVMDTLNTRDYVSVIRTVGGSGAATVVGSSSGRLVSASRTHVKDLKAALKNVKPGGELNVAGTMSVAWKLLTASARAGTAGNATAGCSRVVLWITGGRDACYNTDACRSATAPGACPCTQGVLDEIAERQTELEAVGSSSGAILATLTIGDEVDDSLPRQMACAANGVWARITSGALSASGQSRSTDLTGYYRLLSASRWTPSPDETQVVFSRLYESEGDLGLMTTATLPVFSRGGSRRVLGVVGADIPITRLQAVAPGITPQEIEAEVGSRAPKCEHNGDITSIVRPCDLQELRGKSSMCVPARPPVEQRCFITSATADVIFYTPPDGVWRSWADANSYCDSVVSGSMLAPILQAPDNIKIAQLSAVDGTWIGVTRGQGSSAAGEWVTPSGGRVAYSTWAGGPNSGECVAIDRRGVLKNWRDRSCDDVLPFVCELPRPLLTGTGERPVPTVCGEGAVTDLSDPPPNRNNPLPDSRECPSPPEVEPCRIRPVAVSTKPFCATDPTAKENTCANTCCDGCNCLVKSSVAAEGSLGAGAVVGIIIGVLVVLLFVAVGFALIKRRQDVRQAVDDASDDDGDYYEMRHGSEQSVYKDTDDEGAAGGETDMGDLEDREPSSTERVYHTHQLDQSTQPSEEGLGARGWSWSPGSFLTSRRSG